MTNDEIKNLSAAEAYLQDHPHEILIKAISVLQTRYDLDKDQISELIKSYIICAAINHKNFKKEIVLCEK